MSLLEYYCWVYGIGIPLVLLADLLGTYMTTRKP